jgi:hypothetical protein
MFLYLIFAYQYTKYWIQFAFFIVYSIIFNIKIEEPIRVDSPEKILYDRELERFLRYGSNTEICEKNKNIEGFYYDKPRYKTVFDEPNNEHEVNWKRKILYMTTPAGNIAMFYDPFKLGFSYYADQSYVKYDILNAMAMKYVIMFRCWDFFMDESILSELPSPLIKVHIIEDRKTDISKPNYNAIQASKTDNSPFAKFKKTETVLPLILKNNTNIPIKTQLKDTNRNKFLYLGKIHNMHFIQPIPKKIRKLAFFQSDLLDGVEKNASVQSECLSYKDYIKMQKALKEE